MSIPKIVKCVFGLVHYGNALVKVPISSGIKALTMILLFSSFTIYLFKDGCVVGYLSGIRFFAFPDKMILQKVANNSFQCI